LIDLTHPPGTERGLDLIGAEMSAGGERHRAHEFYANVAGAVAQVGQRRTRLRRSALPITDTELKLMAAAAIIGLRSIPNAG
jgi:hypothetical protein